jgi:hypothetical protein
MTALSKEDFDYKATTKRREICSVVALSLKEKIASSSQSLFNNSVTATFNTN